jgi:nucleoside 2-deoxyribosyltransferase
VPGIAAQAGSGHHRGLRCRPRVYLAGPDVFFPQPWQRGAVLKAICDRHALDGIFPLDGAEPGTAPPRAEVIALANEAHIRGCDAVLANLTPFRGPSADAGTIYEVGFACALGKPVFAYANEAGTYLRRCGMRDPKASQDAQGVWRDIDGLAIEEFGLGENLMIACAIPASGGALFEIAVAPERRWSDLSGVERCAAAIARLFSETPAAATR